jgi:RNA polymerase sigma-70 factor (ECF subfamily)
MTSAVTLLNPNFKTAALTDAGFDKPVPGGGWCYDIDKLRRREPVEFDLLVVREGARIQRLVSRLCGWNDSEDLAQEVFIRAWQSIDRFRGDSDITTWLYAIAINLCRNRRRYGRIRQRWLQAITAIRNNRRHYEEPDRTGQYDQILNAIQMLSHTDRETIVMCCLEERTLDEAAQLLGLRKNAVEVRLHRARKRLKQILKVENE